MSGLAISIDTSGFKKLAADLTKMQKAMPQAIARGLNEGGDKVRTQTQRALQTQTGLLRYSSVTARIRTARAFAGQGDVGTISKGSGIGTGMIYQIVASSKPSTRPSEFPTKVRTGPGGGVAVKMWGVDHLFKRSFQIKGRSGDASLKMRLGAEREPTRGFDGPSIAKEMVKGEAAEAFRSTAERVVIPAIERHVARVLGGA